MEEVMEAVGYSNKSDTVKKIKYNSIFWPGFILAFITFIVYLPALQNGFVNWDDGIYVYENKNIQSLDFKLLSWSLTTRVMDLWHPLSFLSFACDYAIWGLNPTGYHLTNIILHTLNTLLVYILSIRLIAYGHDDFHKKAIVTGLIASLLFGIHPLRVESVAWVAERKDVLCTFFFLLSLYVYIKYVAADKKRFNYAASLIFYILALMSKPMAISLPIVFLILDYYPFKRLTVEGNRRMVLIEKLPFFITGVLIIMIVLWPRLFGNEPNIDAHPLTERLLIFIHGSVFYLQKMILPVNLAPLYPYPLQVRFLDYEYLGSLTLLLLISFFCISLIKQWKVFFCVWLYYIVTLLPVIGVIGVTPQSMADRYTYLPSLAPFLLIGMATNSFIEKYSQNKQLPVVVGLLIILSVILIYKTERQIAIWHDSISLWSYEIKVLPTKGYKGYLNRGNAYTSKKEYQSALADYKKAIELSPAFSEIYYSTLYNRGKLYAELEKWQEAVNDFSSVIALGPKYPTVYYMSINNRGSVYGNLGDYESAVKDFDKVVKLNPKYAMAYQNLGTAYYYWGRYQDAIDNYNMVIKLNPQSGDAYYGIGLSYEKLGNRERATDYFNKASRFRK